VSGDPTRNCFATRPGAVDRWVKEPETGRSPVAAEHSARLTIDVTPALRHRLKVAALQRRVTVADMLRELFEREFPVSEGEIR
jgi:hypothetical protein